MEILKVSGKSVPKSVAGAIAQVLRRDEYVLLQAVGPDAVNQAVKSIAIARCYLVEDSLDLAAYPTFEKIDIEGLVRTAIKFELERRPIRDPSLPRAEGLSTPSRIPHGVERE